MTPSNGTRFPRIPSSLPLRIGLALVSIIAYAVLAAVAGWLEGVEGAPGTGLWFHYVVGAVFGALVLGPFVAPRQRVARFVAMCVASAAIYYLAVRFVVDGPIGYDMILSFILAGGVRRAPVGPRGGPDRAAGVLLEIVVLTLVAGAVGGATFDLKFAFDASLLHRPCRVAVARLPRAEFQLPATRRHTARSCLPGLTPVKCPLAASPPSANNDDWKGIRPCVGR